jgi:hypothetical protein
MNATCTIVGVFADRNAANRVVNELVDLGIDRDRIEIRSNTPDYADVASGNAALTGTEPRDSSSGGIGEWFKRVFGIDDDLEDRAHYRQAWDEGRCIVSVDADERDQSRIADVMDRHDASDIDTQERSSYARARVYARPVDTSVRGYGDQRGYEYSDDEYRRHWQTNFASEGGDYDTYAPAYRYGTEMAADPRYRGRNWDDVEMDLRSDYERHYPDSAWERMKSAVRHGWDSIMGR